MIHLRHRHHSPLTLAALLGMSLLFCISAAAQDDIRFQAQVEQQTVAIGEPFTYRLVVLTSGRSLERHPTPPDFGGLEVIGGPALSSRANIINGRATTENALQWTLRAPLEGNYTISPARLQIDSREFITQPIAIKVVARAPSGLPGSLQDDPILSARGNHPQLNRQLEGRLFLRPVIDNPRPYVSQPFTVSYHVYVDPQLPIQSLDYRQQVQVEGGLVEELFLLSQQVNFNQESYDGRIFNVARAAEYRITPTRAGELVIDRFAMLAGISNGRRDLFAMLDPGMAVELPTMPLRIEVRPLPTEGRPTGFTGTVGRYRLSAGADRDSLSQHELLTLKLTLEGEGPIGLAGAPPLPTGVDFELIDQAQETHGQSRVFHFSLRPLRPGSLTIPPFSYPVFDPEAERYEILRTDPIPITVTPGERTADTIITVTPAADENFKKPRLHPVRVIERTRAGQPRPLAHLPLLWALHGAGVGALLLAWRRDHTRLTDPAALRRNQARRTLTRRLRALRQQASALQTAEAAGALEQAVRGFIADRFNVAPDGLTRPRIEQLLADNGLSSESTARLLTLLDACGALRYAPRESDANLTGWCDEIETLLWGVRP